MSVMFFLREPGYGTAYLEASRAGLRSWKRRKWARWFTPNWVSKPSVVLDSGIAIYVGDQSLL
jgi:hypothetical protein